MDSTKIVNLYLQRNPDAISHTTALYGERLFRLALAITRDEQDSKEAENDTYLSAWDSIPPNKPYSYLFSFLAKITRNLSIDIIRKKGAQKRGANLTAITSELEQSIPSSDNTERKIEEGEIVLALNAFLENLSERDRVLFVRRYFFAEKISEIAVRFSLSESLVKSSLARNRKKLLKHFESEGITI